MSPGRVGYPSPLCAHTSSERALPVRDIAFGIEYRGENTAGKRLPHL